MLNTFVPSPNVTKNLGNFFSHHLLSTSKNVLKAFFRASSKMLHNFFGNTVKKQEEVEVVMQEVLGPFVSSQFANSQKMF